MQAPDHAHGRVCGELKALQDAFQTVASLQSNDYHLDRPLYFACREDRERFCHKIQAGNGAVLQCLLKNKHDGQMSGRVRLYCIVAKTFISISSARQFSTSAKISWAETPTSHIRSSTLAVRTLRGKLTISNSLSMHSRTGPNAVHNNPPLTITISATWFSAWKHLSTRLKGSIS